MFNFYEHKADDDAMTRTISLTVIKKESPIKKKERRNFYKKKKFMMMDTMSLEQNKFHTHVAGY